MGNNCWWYMATLREWKLYDYDPQALFLFIDRSLQDLRQHWVVGTTEIPILLKFITGHWQKLSTKRKKGHTLVDWEKDSTLAQWCNLVLKSIIQPSSELLKFLGNLSLNVSKPQKKHLWRTVEALIASEGRKTLAGLYRQWVEAPDVSAVADFFRQSPWSEQQIRQSLSKWVIADLIQRGQTQKIKPIIHVSIDDSLTTKDKDTSALEGRLQGTRWTGRIPSSMTRENCFRRWNGSSTSVTAAAAA